MQARLFQRAQRVEEEPFMVIYNYRKTKILKKARDLRKLKIAQARKERIEAVEEARKERLEFINRNRF